MDHRANRLGAALTLLGTAAAAHAQTRVVYVDQTAPAGGDGASWQNAFNDLQEALAGINSTPTPIEIQLEIRIAQGTYLPTTYIGDAAFDLHPPGPLMSAMTLSIRGAYGGLRSLVPDRRDFALTATILSANHERCQVLKIRTPPSCRSLEIDGLQLQDASCVGSFDPLQGSGLRIDRQSQCPVTVMDCRVLHNSNPDSPAVLLPTGQYSSVLDSNVLVLRCVVSENHASHAISCAGSARIEDSEISENDATDPRGYPQNGAGLFAPAGAIIRRCLIAGNRGSPYGGAIYTESWTWIDNCLLAWNSAGLAGGAIFATEADSSSCTVAQCTIVGNTARWGGGVFRESGRLVVSNSLLAGNHATDAGSQVASVISPAEYVSSAVEGGRSGTYVAFASGDPPPNHEVLDLDPAFIDPNGPDNQPATWRDNNYQLRPRSQCVDRGSFNVGDPSGLDLLGHPRWVVGQQGRSRLPDLGCYESQLTLCPSDMNADGGVTVDDFIAFIEAYAAGGWLADVTTDGGSPTPDGAVTIDDLLYFLARFEGGC